MAVEIHIFKGGGACAEALDGHPRMVCHSLASMQCTGVSEEGDAGTIYHGTANPKSIQNNGAGSDARDKNLER